MRIFVAAAAPISRHSLRRQGALHRFVDLVFGRCVGHEAGDVVIDHFGVAAYVRHDGNAPAQNCFDDGPSHRVGRDKAVMIVPDRGDVADESAERNA